MFWQVFYSECKKQGTSPNAVCKAIGLSNATATGWKNGTLPKADVLVKIADVLHVSADYLLGRADGEKMFFNLKQTVDEMGQKNAPDSGIKSVIANKINHKYRISIIAGGRVKLFCGVSCDRSESARPAYTNILSYP